MKRILTIIMLIGLAVGLASAQNTSKIKSNLTIEKASPMLYLNGTSAGIDFYNGDLMLQQSSNQLTLSGGNLSLGSNSLLMTGSLGITGSRLLKGWFTDLEITNLPTVNGAAFKTALSLTASDVGLGNVTNESKATMFTSPTFTTQATFPATVYIPSSGVFSFNSGDVTLTHGSNVLTLGGGNLALGANSITLTGSIGVTGARVTKGWFTDLEVTNAIAGSITGNAATVTGFTSASGSLTLAGADPLILNTTAASDVIVPTAGTLATTVNIETRLQDKLDSAEIVVSASVWEANVGNYLLRELQALGSVAIVLPIGASQPHTTNKTLADGTAYWQSFYLPVIDTITGMQFIQRTQGGYTAADSNCVALYSVSGATYTRVAMSANNGDLWKGAGYSLQTVDFTSPYIAAAGVYMICMTYNQSAETTPPNIYCWNGSSTVSQLLTGTNANRISGTVSAATGPPTTEVAGDLTASDVIYGIWLY